MAGIFGVVSEENLQRDLFLGTFYLQHRAQDYCGLLSCDDGGKLNGSTHKGMLKQSFTKDDLLKLKGNYGIGSVSVTREPSSGLSRYQLGTICFDGSIYNSVELKDNLLRGGVVFAGYHYPEDVPDSDLISNIVLREPSFEKGIERLLELAKGDFSILNLTRDGIFAARGYGRKPLILGKKGGAYAVSSESTSFINTGFKIERDVEPGEIVFIDRKGFQRTKKFELGDKVKFGTFEWIYTAYPTSIIDGRAVHEVRFEIGRQLAKAFPVAADVVSPIPNSGRWHGIGFNYESYASGLGVPYGEVFVRFDYSDRSFTPGSEEVQQEVADIKLIPVEGLIKGKRIVIVDDSIVRGTQTKNQVGRLKQCGAKEVHARIACPPLMGACPYGKSTKRDEDCIARRMSIEDIRVSRELDSLEYATIEMLERATGFPRSKLCLECWVPEQRGC